MLYSIIRLIYRVFVEQILRSPWQLTQICKPFLEYQDQGGNIHATAAAPAPPVSLRSV